MGFRPRDPFTSGNVRHWARPPIRGNNVFCVAQRPSVTATIRRATPRVHSSSSSRRTVGGPPKWSPLPWPDPCRLSSLSARLATHDVANLAQMHSETLPQFPQRHAAQGVVGPDVANVLVGEFRHPVAFAARDALRVKPEPVLVAAGCETSALRIAVGHVFVG